MTAPTMLTLGAWLHDLNPFLVEFSPGIGLRWYGLSYAAGFLAGWWILIRLARRGFTPLSPQRVGDAMVALIVGVIVGGRLGYVLFYDLPLLWNFSDSFPWWGVLRVSQGGMASHGGMLGVIIATWLISRPGKHDEYGPRGPVPWLHVLDLTALACTPGLFFGRIANFINGELLGKIVAPPGEPAPWWAVRFPQERLDWWLRDAPPGQPRGHAPVLTPEQQFQLDALLTPYRKGGLDDYDAYARLLNDLQTGPARVSHEVAAKLAPLIAARHPSQLYQAVAEGLVVGVLLWLLWKRPRKPGVIVSVFLISYGVLRVLTEFVRLPDSHLAVQRFAGLSRGQWLSVVMVVCGVALLAYFLRRAAPRMGGWGAARIGAKPS